MQIPDASELAPVPVPLPCELPLLGAELLEDPLLELPLELPVVLPALLFSDLPDLSASECLPVELADAPLVLAPLAPVGSDADCSAFAWATCGAILPATVTPSATTPNAATAFTPVLMARLRAGL